MNVQLKFSTSFKIPICFIRFNKQVSSLEVDELMFTHSNFLYPLK